MGLEPKSNLFYLGTCGLAVVIDDSFHSLVSGSMAMHRMFYGEGSPNTANQLACLCATMRHVSS